jgi:hypothetical protein
MPGLGKFLSASTQATSTIIIPQAQKMAHPFSQAPENPTGPETPREEAGVAQVQPLFRGPCYFAQPPKSLYLQLLKDNI